jgi:hypothetical protein
MNANGGVGGTGPPRYKTNARAARQTPLSIGHEGCPTLLAACNEFNVTLIFVKTIEHGQIAFPRNAKCVRDALGNQTFDQEMAADLIRIACIIHIDILIAHTASLGEGRMILSKRGQRLSVGEL